MMEAPEYLDLDEIDFSDDISYSITSLKTIPELCRRCDAQNEDRSVPSANWNCGVSSLIGNTQKPTGIADIYSKFRPVKRVSPLKHQPESPKLNESDDQKEEKEENEKNGEPGKSSGNDGEDGGFKCKNMEPGVLLGELEHYDLDMDEILDVPYIKSSQPLTLFTKVASEKRISSIHPISKEKTSPMGNLENLAPNATPYCVLSPVKNSAQPAVLDPGRHSSGGLEHSQSSIQSSSIHEPDCYNKGFLNRALSDSHAQKLEKSMPNCQLRPFHLPAPDTQLDGINGNVNWSYSEGEDMKKIKSILNIVREGQISLLPHIAVDNLDQIHDENGNNLLHIAASQGHAECLQHLTSLMGEDCLNERNEDKLTPAGLAIKTGQLECVRWMVSETEAIAELSCTKDHPSLIHYAANYGQEKILLWLLQFMQEQGISLDETDKCGYSAVHIASQHGYLGCIQTLVEYGANVTIQNHSGEKPSQTAEHQGHSMCSRYLVVVETCMSLASQVVKLTKQLKEQTAERITLQTHLQQLLEAQRSLPTSPSAPSSPASGSLQRKTLEDPAANKLNGTQEGSQPLSTSLPSRLRCRTLDEESDKILRQLLGKDLADNVSSPEKLSLEFQDGHGNRIGKRIPLEKREFKLARLRQIMQRSLSESDTDSNNSNNSEDQKNTPVRKNKPRPQPIVESVENSETLQMMIKKHTQSNTTGRRFVLGLKSKSVDGHSPSPTSESSDPDYEPQYQSGSILQSSESPLSPTSSSAQKTTSPKSALKSPSSKRRASQNLKLRVTFEDPVVQVEQTEIDNEIKDKDSAKTSQKASSNGEAGEQQKRTFGAFRSIMETFSNNQNNNNNSQSTNNVKAPSSSFSSLGRKSTDTKASPANSGKGKNKTA